VKPIKAQWVKKRTKNIFTFFENASNKPIVNTATEQGITGDVIIGN